jgi:carboxypeptidase C (cathepsin A)
MRFSVLLAAALAIFSAAFVPAVLARDDYSARALEDEVHNLPGAQFEMPFRHFSGYIPVAGGKRQIFYWFFEAYGDGVDATKAPITWWTSGGPGCAGTGVGGLGENGPLTIDRSGAVKLRQWSWSKFTSMLYVDQPAGVGFSTAAVRPSVYTDALSAAENYEFLIGWFQRFPNYKPNKFFLSSESYGGHYVPTLALEIAKRDPADSINFAGFVVGNPLTYMPYRDFAQVHTYATHQLVPDPLWRQYAAKCLPDPAAPTPNPPAPRDRSCDGLESQILSYGSGLDPYALDFPVCTGTRVSRLNKTGSTARYVDQKTQFLAHIRRAHSLYKGSVSAANYFPEEYEPCVDSLDTTFMNRPEVRKALHVDPKAPAWGICADINYSASDMIDSMIPVYKELKTLYANRLKMLIYAGDNDSICAPVGEQQWIWNQGFEVLKKWAPWKVNQQVAGFHVKFSGLDFITVHGAGHMAPATRPEHTFTAIRAFMYGKL